jgi:DNA-binding NtrC family response regulator
MQRVVIIDDEPGFAETLRKMLGNFGYDVAIANDLKSKKALDLRDDDIVFVDIRTSKLSWHQLLRTLASMETKASIVMMGKQFEPLQEAEKVAKALRLNLIGAMEKPFRLDDLKDVLPGGPLSLSRDDNIVGFFR